MIIAFSKDWNDVPTCTTHILRELGRTEPVLWIESIGTRRPKLTRGGKDWGRLARRLAGMRKGAERKENYLWVLAPVLVPKPTTRWQCLLNNCLFRLQEGAALRRAFRHSPLATHHSQPQYWSFIPNTVDLLPRRRRGAVVYYCTDNWSLFPNLNGAYLAAKERELVACADVVFATSMPLVYRMQAMLDETKRCRTQVIYTPHGVEHAKFAGAMADDTRIPDDMAWLPKPVVGFYGNICSWIDFELIAELAVARPTWSFVLIGAVQCDVSRATGVANVHFLGRREHNDLPAYCSGFNAAMIPYDLSDPRMETVNPVKARELLAAGVPVVAADLPELRVFGDDVLCCHGKTEWLTALEKQIARQDRADISQRVAHEDWMVKVAELRRHVQTTCEGRPAVDFDTIVTVS